MEFTYENRQIKKGDAVTLIDGIQKDVMYGRDKDFYIDSKVLNIIKRFATLMYVYEISNDQLFCKVQTKKRKGKNYDIFLPTDLFKIVKLPKQVDVINWMFDNKIVEFPAQWIFFKSEMSTIVRFLPRIFQYNLKALWLIDKDCNHLYNNDDPLDVLMYYKTIVQQLDIKYQTLYTRFNRMVVRKSFIDTVLKINPEWNSRDAISIYNLNNHGVFNDIPYLSNADRLDHYKNPKKKIEYENSAAFAGMKEYIVEQEKQNALIKRGNDSRYLQTLDQSVIDELELTIFNVKTLPNRNQILFIFIDKDNNKRFYIDDFKFIFYISSNPTILNNDYIVDFDENKHSPYLVTSFDVLRNLKFAVADNYKRFMKKGKF